METTRGLKRQKPSEKKKKRNGQNKKKGTKLMKKNTGIVICGKFLN